MTATGTFTACSNTSKRSVDNPLELWILPPDEESADIAIGAPVLVRVSKLGGSGNEICGTWNGGDACWQDIYPVPLELIDAECGDGCAAEPVDHSLAPLFRLDGSLQPLPGEMLLLEVTPNQIATTLHVRARPAQWWHGDEAIVGRTFEADLSIIADSPNTITVTPRLLGPDGARFAPLAGATLDLCPRIVRGGIHFFTYPSLVDVNLEGTSFELLGFDTTTHCPRLRAVAPGASTLVMHTGALTSRVRLRAAAPEETVSIELREVTDPSSNDVTQIGVETRRDALHLRMRANDFEQPQFLVLLTLRDGAQALGGVGAVVSDDEDTVWLQPRAIEDSLLRPFPMKVGTTHLRAQLGEGSLDVPVTVHE